MALITVNNVNTTLDETAGLQNLFATPSPAGDADDNDTSLTIPLAFSGRLTALTSSTITGTALSGYTGAPGNTGSDVISIDPAAAGTITNLAFVGSDGNLLNGVDSGLDTLDGTNILLYSDTNDNIVLGRAGSSSGAIVFAVYLEETASGAKIWSVEYQPFKHPDATNPDDSLNLANKIFVSAEQNLEFSLAGAPSGQNLFLMFTKANPATFVDANNIVRISDPVIVATGKDPANQSVTGTINTGDTINTSQAGGPTTFGTNNQMIVEGEGIRFTFVTGARQGVTVPNLDQNEADIEANIDFTGLVQHSREADFDVVQLQSGKTAVVKITAYSTALETGTAFIDGYGNDATVGITNIRVVVGTTVLIDTGVGATANGVTVAFSNGIATVSGVKAGYNIEYTTVADHNRVLVENAGSGKGQASADFDIGGFTLHSSDASQVEVGSKIFFEDDGPTLTAEAATSGLQVDETNLLIDDTADFSGQFTPNYGADGAGSVGGYTLDVTTPGSDSGLDDTFSGQSIYLYKDGDDVVGRVGSADAADPAGAVAFRLSVVATTGVVTLDQVRAVVHPDPSDPDDVAGLIGSNLITLSATVTDQDGDTNTAAADITAAISFRDDGPTLTAEAATSGLQVDETNLLIDDTADFSGQFTPNYGADGAGTVGGYTLDVTTPGSDSGLDDTFSGQSIYLYKDGDDVVGRVGSSGTSDPAGAVAFRLSVVATTGVVTLDQVRAVVHANPSDPDEVIGLTGSNLVTLSATVTDKDGDTNTAAADITAAISFRDDGPTDFTPASVSLVNSGTATASGDLFPAPDTLDFSGHVGADQLGSIAFVDNYPADDYLRSSTSGTILTSGTENIVLSGFGTGTLTATTETTGLTVFTATLDPATDSYAIDFDRAIDDGGHVSFLGAAPVRSGNPTYNLIQDVGDTTIDLLFSGGNVNGGLPASHTVNVSTNGAGTDNQSMNPGETLRIDIVNNGVLAGQPSGSDFNYSTHEPVNGFSFNLTQNTPGGSNATAFVQAFDADNDKILVGDPGDQLDHITKVMINDQVLVDGNTINTLTINNQTVNAILYNDGVIITGLNEGQSGDGIAGVDDPVIKIFTADGFNRLEVSNYSGQTVNGVTLGGDSFDIAPAGFDVAVQGNPIDFALPLQIADGDLDTTAVSLIGVHLDPVVV